MCNYKSLSLFILLLSFNSYSAITTSFSVGYSLSASNEFDKYNVEAKGISQSFQLGLRKEYDEIGFFLDVNSLNATIIHDGEESVISLKDNTLGGYYTHYFEYFYIQLGYGKNSTKQSIQSTLSPGQISTIENLYGVKSSGTQYSSQLKIRLAYRLLKLSSVILNGYYERAINQDSGFNTNTFGIDSKISF